MTTARYRTGSQYVATATALLLSIPPVGNPSQSAINLTTTAGYQALGKVGAMVADAVTPSVYSSANSEVLSSLLLDVAAKLLTQSKSLDTDYSAVVDREFWKLL